MLHEITIDGLAFRLRPITDFDASFVCSLRCDPGLSRFLHKSPSIVEDQLAWQARYYRRTGDWYFVLEKLIDERPEGLISIYNFDAMRCSAEWGRWILRPGSLASIESAWLIYRCAFETLQLREVYCRTIVDNHSVISFHDSCGIKKKKIFANYFNFNGCSLDALEHRVDRFDWKKLEPRLKELASRIAERLNFAS